MIELSNRKDLLNLIGQGTKPSVKYEVCPICGEKRYQVWIKGSPRFMGCLCHTLRHPKAKNPSLKKS